MRTGYRAGKGGEEKKKNAERFLKRLSIPLTGGLNQLLPLKKLERADLKN